MKKRRLVKRTMVYAEVPDLERCIGKTVLIDGEKIKIETIAGNIGMTIGRRPEHQRPQYAEINGQYRLSFLRLFAQINNETYTEEEFLAFENMQVWAEANRDDSEDNRKSAAKIVDNVMKAAKENKC